MSQVFPLLLFNRLLFGGNVDIGGGFKRSFRAKRKEVGMGNKQTGRSPKSRL